MDERFIGGRVRMPFNPVRRNRNIGTPKQGHGQNNRMIVPRPWTSAGWCVAQLNPGQMLRRTVNGRDVTLIVEKTSGGCVHACSVEDVVFLLSHVPLADWAGLETFVLRQPTRKARVLRPAWGRMFYYADLGFRGSSLEKSGPALFLEACNVGDTIEWSTSLDPEDAAELDRLRLDGHKVSRVGKKHLVSTSLDSVRATQLYRTLLHEIGHWVDWLGKVEAPFAQDEDYSTLYDRYFARPKGEVEAFAHRYADNLRETLEKRGVIPFSRIEG
ncbi:MAG: hypothetical protein EOQ98_15500 [Mesorhizobium sp.]|uniref:hypothetical protein n=1 Tax=Mesorhizobium sp. TaxID=1871066 RepID=UPI000FE7A6B2|nr:hypothetical protein [Mesorhizobium sp.]RWO98606.1 MAG: hypothetical protein EOQ98_15500 [Mesorhizobium sp.]TIM33566.1 MAG: hypothetical protein E5Y69_22920 [Mesorhizobium sp.]